MTKDSEVVGTYRTPQRDARGRPLAGSPVVTRVFQAPAKKAPLITGEAIKTRQFEASVSLKVGGNSSRLELRPTKMYSRGIVWKRGHTVLIIRGPTLPA